MSDDFYAVIMAGGGGTRLWPLSRKDRPKQMLRLIDERTMFQMAVQRLEGLFAPENILVVTVAEQAVELRKECPAIPEENFILEPMPKGTASVVGLAAVALYARNPMATMAILTADHFMRNTMYFQQLLRAGYAAAQKGSLVTLGIHPTFPATGYGYIQRGDRLEDINGMAVYRMLRFKEKPDDATAREMVLSGDYDWNSGMFLWQVRRILAEFERQMPDLYAGLQDIQRAWGSTEQEIVIRKTWEGIRPETIDYGIMEHAENAVILPAMELGWSDVGSWDSLFEVLTPDESGNIIFGEHHIGLDTEDTLVYVRDTSRLIVTIGVNDLIVVDSGDALLICRKEQSQKVRNLVRHLQRTDRNEYL